MLNNKYYFFKINQNIDFEMYVGKMSILDLYNLHDVKPLTEDADDISEELLTKDYLNRGLVAQRGERKDRIKEISLYIGGSGIPNSIILGNIIGNNSVNFRESLNGMYEIKVDENLDDKNKLFVIDGQHRLKGAALYTYDKIIKNIIKEFNSNTFDQKKEIIDDLLRISTEKDYSVKITKIKELKFDKNISNIYERVLSRLDIVEFPIVILNKISNNKIVEIFTDINTLVKPLDSNINRYYYGRFTTKFPYLNISVNVAKLLNENESSPMCGLIKMPYKSKYDKGFSKVGVGAFCERFNGVAELKGLDKDIKKIDFFKKPLGILINETILSGEEKYAISDDTIIDLIEFFFIFFAYSYSKIKDLYYTEVTDKNIPFDSKEYKNYKFIDSTANELYFSVIKFLLIFIIVDNNFDIKKVINFEKEKISKSIGNNFQLLQEPLANIFIDNNYFKRGETEGTGWAKSAKIVKNFEDSLLKNLKDIDKVSFNNALVEQFS